MLYSPAHDLLLWAGAYRGLTVSELGKMSSFRLDSKDYLSALALTGDGKTIVAADAETYDILAWDRSSGRLLGNLAGHNNRVLSLAFHPSRQFLVSVSRADESVRIWDMAKRLQIKSFRVETWDGPYAAVFSPDGKQLLICVGNNVEVFDLADIIANERE
jgi:WD40 repeat protein